MLPDEVGAVDLKDEDETLLAQDTSISNSRANNSSGKENTRNIVCGTLGCEEEGAHQRRITDIMNMRCWEAKCLGVNYLGFDELQQHNNTI